MDTFEIRKTNIMFFKKEEREFWSKLRVMHNYWVESGMVKGEPQLNEELDFHIEHDKPNPLEDRETVVRTVDMEVKNGYLDMRTALERLYPDLSEEQLDERMRLVSQERQVVQIEEEEDGSAESSNPDSDGDQADEQTSDR